MSDREHLHVSVTICSAFNAIMRLRFGVFCETIRSNLFMTILILCCGYKFRWKGGSIYSNRKSYLFVVEFLVYSGSKVIYIQSCIFFVKVCFHRLLYDRTEQLNA